MRSPAARVSTQAGGSHTVTGTDVARSSAPALGLTPGVPAAGQRTARVARRVPDSSTRTSAGPEQGPHNRARFTPGESVSPAADGFVPLDVLLLDGLVLDGLVLAGI